MRALWSSGILAVAIVLLNGCGSHPSKPKVQSNPISPAIVYKYQRLNLNIPLQLPVRGVARRLLVDTWGAARSGGRFHEGIDIMAPRGTKVLSSTDGVVADMRSSGLGGKVIWIYGPKGSWHYYAHLNNYKRGLQVGDRVNAGDVIAEVGNTGNARGGSPHLHYGLYLAGKGRGAVNPYPYLR